MPDDYRHFITRDWAEPYRQRRANQLLREVERHPVFGMTIIQGDILTPDAADMLPLLLKPEPRNNRAARVRELMGRWNRFMLARRPEPLIYEAWIWELQRGLLADRLGDELFYDMASPKVPLLMRIVRDRPQWCDNPKTAATETCDDAIAAALDRALDWIARRQGGDIDTWQWGTVIPSSTPCRCCATWPRCASRPTAARTRSTARPRAIAVHARSRQCTARAIARSTISAISTTAASPSRSASRAT